jgi:hypothetical protein
MTEEQHEIIESSAEMLYGLIHARYILTSRGMNAVVRTRSPHPRPLHRRRAQVQTSRPVVHNAWALSTLGGR